jgi:hypothetical protein
MAESLAESGGAAAGLRVLVVGQGERAAARCAWYRAAGIAVLEGGPDDRQEFPSAALYDLCSEPAERQRALRQLLRRRHAAVLVAGPLAATAEAAAHLVAAARRQRCRLAIMGGTRFVPAWARLQEFVGGGIMGAVREVQVQVTSTPGQAAEAWSAAMNLGLWLAGDGVPVAEQTTPASTSFLAGSARIRVAGRTDGTAAATTWHVTLVADLGQAVAATVYDLGLPGRQCRDSSLEVTLGGRRRRLELPAADPAGNELAALLIRLGAGLPWLALCAADRAASLLAVQEEGARKVSVTPFEAS